MNTMPSPVNTNTVPGQVSSILPDLIERNTNILHLIGLFVSAAMKLYKEINTCINPRVTAVIDVILIFNVLLITLGFLKNTNSILYKISKSKSVILFIITSLLFIFILTGSASCIYPIPPTSPPPPSPPVISIPPIVIPTSEPNDQISPDLITMSIDDLYANAAPNGSLITETNGFWMKEGKGFKFSSDQGTKISYDFGNNVKVPFIITENNDKLIKIKSNDEAIIFKKGYNKINSIFGKPVKHIYILFNGGSICQTDSVAPALAIEVAFIDNKKPNTSVIQSSLIGTNNMRNRILCPDGGRHNNIDKIKVDEFISISPGMEPPRSGKANESLRLDLMTITVKDDYKDFPLDSITISSTFENPESFIGIYGLTLEP